MEPYNKKQRRGARLEEEVGGALDGGAVAADEHAHRLERVQALVRVLLVHAVEQLPQPVSARGRLEVTL